MTQRPQRRTKIIATVGPARGGDDDTIVGPDGRSVDARVDQATQASWLIEAGADVLRFNMSFAGYSSVYGANEMAYLEYLYRHRDGIARRVAVLGDLPGPKVRLAEIRVGDDDVLAVGQSLALDFGPGPFSPDAIGASVHVNGRPFGLEVDAIDEHADIDAFVAANPGALMTIGDGRLRLQAETSREGVVRCRVVKAGRLQRGKGLTIRGADLTVRAFGENDHRALDFLLSAAGPLLAWVAVSYARSAEDVLEVKQWVAEWIERAGVDGPGPGVLVKVETRSAWEGIDAILDVADGAMVARGDLGEQLPIEDIPSIQKDLIRKCNVRGKPVITATQMLDSMESNPDPTRAECTDVYNAVLDGTDAVMLSGETSAGMYPTQAVATMDRVTRQAERRFFEQRPPFELVVDQSRALLVAAAPRLKVQVEEAFTQADKSGDAVERERWRWRGSLFTAKLARNRQQSITDRIGAAACALAEGESAAAIIAPTSSGRTVWMISRFRPQPMIIGAAHDQYTYRKLILGFGVVPIHIGRGQSTMSEVLDDAVREARRVGLLPAVDGVEVVATAGTPLFKADTTNLVQILRLENPESEDDLTPPD